MKQLSYKKISVDKLITNAVPCKGEMLVAYIMLNKTDITWNLFNQATGEVLHQGVCDNVKKAKLSIRKCLFKLEADLEIKFRNKLSDF